MTSTDAELKVYSDYVCPFCYLGRRSLERYEAERGEEMTIDWHPFDLRSHQRGSDGEIDPDVPDGKDEEYYEQARENVRRLQERYDVDMTLDIAEDIDSLQAQQVSYHIKQDAPEQWRDFDEAVFEALWLEGRDIGDRAVLRDLVADVELDPALVDAALDDEALRQQLHDRFEEAQRHGVTGVPTFAYDGYAARGAVPPEQLRRLIEGTD
ncbi:MAG: DsbA family protein [Halobacteriales archaeon]